MSYLILGFRAGLPLDPEFVSDWPQYRIVERPAAGTWTTLARELRAGSVTSAAHVSELPPGDRLWIALEFAGSLYLDRASVPELEPGLRRTGWIHRHKTDEYRVLDPPVVAPVERPPTLPATVAAATDALDDVDVFGDLAVGRLGGSSALLALSRRSKRDEHVVVRTLEELELGWVEHGDALWRVRHRGAVEVVAVGMSASTSIDDVAERFVDHDGIVRAWQERTPVEGMRYSVLLQIVAPDVDPPVWAPVGQIWEQQGVAKHQTLATAVPISAEVAPGEAVSIVAAAWCLNRDLDAPSGEALAVTPLHTRYDQTVTQEQVWEHRSSLPVGWGA